VQTSLQILCGIRCGPEGWAFREQSAATTLPVYQL